jgi:hypothetical protein
MAADLVVGSTVVDRSMEISAGGAVGAVGAVGTTGVPTSIMPP